eukprot:352312-Chlamydomonas_euryale.AAC.21
MRHNMYRTGTVSLGMLAAQALIIKGQHTTWDVPRSISYARGVLGTWVEAASHTCISPPAGSLACGSSPYASARRAVQLLRTYKSKQRSSSPWLHSRCHHLEAQIQESRIYTRESQIACQRRQNDVCNSLARWKPPPHGGQRLAFHTLLCLIPPNHRAFKPPFDSPVVRLAGSLTIAAERHSAHAFLCFKEGFLFLSGKRGTCPPPNGPTPSQMIGRT